MAKTTINIEDIKKLIPHRYPMILVDRIIDIEPGESAIGIKNVTANDWFFTGHFPDHPIMPGVLIIEALAQTSAVLVVKTLQENKKASTTNKHVYFMSIEGAKFRKPVIPGDQLQLIVTKYQTRGNVWRFKGEAKVDETLVAQAMYTAMIVD